MEVNQVSGTNFQGMLRIKAKESCPARLIKLLQENRFVRDFQKGDKDLLITVKHRCASRIEVQKFQRDEDLYKILFTSASFKNSRLGRFFNFLSSKTECLAKDFDYHSEDTNLKLLSSDRRMKKIFDKLV